MTNRIPALVALALMVCVGTPAARPKSDVVVVRNGDRVTCEVKSLSMGMVTASTDAMGTVYIKWEDVIAVHSSFMFRVETSAGQLLFGSLEETERSDMLVVAGVTSIGISHLDVVEIIPIELTFWDRNNGSLSAGFSYARSTDLAQLHADWTNYYTGERNLVVLKASTTVTTETDEESTKRMDVSLTYYQLLSKNKWAAALSPSIQRNDELGLKRRVLLAAGVGVSAIKSNRNRLLVSAGVALNSELGADTTETTESGELFVAGDFSLFKYHSPKREINASLSLYPSMTENERYRLDFDLAFRIEVISDLFIELSYYMNFDSDPPTADAHKEDYGIMTSVGYTY
jgi:hypothetical protein